MNDKKNSSEIQISGNIDNYLFGSLKDPYFKEIENSPNIFINNLDNREFFLQTFFSLFLENNPFKKKTNYEIFNEIINIGKLNKYCPNFYKIYRTIIPKAIKSQKIVEKDNLYLKSENIQSDKFNIYSFLEEILDSPSHLSKNTLKNHCNQIRIYNNSNFIEIFIEGTKIKEGQLVNFLSFNEHALEDDFTFKFSTQQKKSFDKFNKNKLNSFFEITPTALTVQKSIRYDGFWPIKFFEFVFKDVSQIKENNLYSLAKDHFRYDKKREVIVCFNNVSKCIFKIKEKLNYEKLSYLRLGLDEGIRLDVINYSDNINLFNYISYDGKLIKPEEIIYRDKGISINLTNERQNNKQLDFYKYFID